MSVQFIRFILVGAIAAAVNIGCRVFFSQLIAFEYAVALAFPAGLAVGFFLSRTFVFPSSENPIGSQITRFVTINLLALAQVWLVSVGMARLVFPLTRYTWHAELFAHTIGVLSPVVTSYLGHKHFTFRKALDENS